MNNSKHIQTILNGSMHSLKTILPSNINFHAPSILSEPYIQKEMGVLIGLLGDIKGRVILDSTSDAFSAIGAQMFGMPLEGEMLESFTGEFGNMFAGNLCTHVGTGELNIDITPPTVMVGHTKLFGFEKCFRLPTTIENAGALTILFTIDE
ncbi:chemotaxis protein CheX [Lysinibacillus endophyticus]|uniref:Chemotaxis protein CheX n=1 Tax=Ureibacillus endophyticus TaxID=1978490 RepID=A0A494Z206_9BACL|nr:chemotaxis protein CheX [Lysinibacillus endophyticus]MCP1144334.1 chemotaxis protein CheX [Lysinibacillus endophyticus]RKQ16504.1 chemotaxis protein CheX [Lysinibacillus endophyticus]